MSKQTAIVLLLTVLLIVLIIYFERIKNKVIKVVTSMGSKGGLNNPGNIRTSAITWKGEITKPGDTFESFDTLENGIRAMYSNLLAYRNKYGLDTVRGIISRWAPSNENNTEAYINFVCSKMGVTPDEHLPLSKYPALISAISKQEGNIYVALNDVSHIINVA